MVGIRNFDENAPVQAIDFNFSIERSGSRFKPYIFAFAIIAGISAAIAAISLSGYLGVLKDLGQIESISLMVAGGVGVLSAACGFSILKLISLCKAPTQQTSSGIEGEIGDPGLITNEGSTDSNHQLLNPSGQNSEEYNARGCGSFLSGGAPQEEISTAVEGPRLPISKTGNEVRASAVTIQEDLEVISIEGAQELVNTGVVEQDQAVQIMGNNGISGNAGIIPEEISTAVEGPRIPVFGKEMWKIHFNVDVGEEPPLPDDLANILNSPCPFFKDGRKVEETHLIPVLIPATVEGQPFHLNLFNEMMTSQNLPIKLSYQERVKQYIGNQPVRKSYWVLMTKEVIPESIAYSNYVNRDGAEILVNIGRQEQIAAIKASSQDYGAPTVLEASVSAVMWYLYSGGEKIFDLQAAINKARREGRQMVAYSRCQDLIQGYYNPVIGSFDQEGVLEIDGNFETKGYANVGAVAARRFL